MQFRPHSATVARTALAASRPRTIQHNRRAPSKDRRRLIRSMSSASLDPTVPIPEDTSQPSQVPETDPASYEDLVAKKRALHICFLSGRVGRAEDLLATIEEKDNEVWNITISGYHRNGRVNICWQIYEELEASGIKPDMFIYASMLQVCLTGLNFDKAVEIWEAVKADPDCKPDRLVHNLLIQVCIACRRLDQALKFFEEIKELGGDIDIVAYNTLLSGAAKDSVSEKEANALMSRLTQELDSVGLQPDVYTYRAFMNIAMKSKDTAKALDFLQQMMNSGISIPSKFCMTVIELFARGPLPQDSPRPIIEACWDLYLRQEEDSRDSRSVLDPIMRLLTRCRQWRSAFGVLSYLASKNMPVNYRTYEIIIKEMARARNSNHELFMSAILLAEKMVASNLVIGETIYSALIRICLDAKEMDQAMKYLNEMRERKYKPERTLYNSMINILTDRRYSTNAENARIGILQIEELMKEDKIPFDVYAYSGILRILSKCMDVEGVDRIFAEMKENRVTPTLASYNSVLHMYSRFSDPASHDRAWQLFREIKEQGVTIGIVTHTLMFGICIASKDLDAGLMLFNEMKEARIAMNAHIFSSMMQLAGEAQKFDMVEDFLQQLDEYGLRANEHTYNVLINVYGQAGNMDKVLEIYADYKEKKLGMNITMFTNLVTAATLCNRTDLIYQFFDDFKQAGFLFDREAYGFLASTLETAGDNEGAMAMRELEKKEKRQGRRLVRN